MVTKKLVIASWKKVYGTIWIFVMFIYYCFNINAVYKYILKE